MDYAIYVIAFLWSAVFVEPPREALAPFSVAPEQPVRVFA